MHSRRAFLAAMAAGTAGCLGDPPSGDSTTTADPGTTREPTTSGPTTTDPPATSPPATTPGPTRVELSNVRHQHSAITVQADSGSVDAFDDQVLFCTVEATGDDQPDRSAMSLVAGDRQYDTFLATNEGGLAYEYYRLPDAYIPGERSGWVGFEVPAPLSAADLRVTVDLPDETVEWSVPDEAAAALAREPPSFELRSFSVPDSVDSGRGIQVSATIHNSGGPGIFRGVTNAAGATYTVDLFEVSIPSGETVTTTAFEASGLPEGELRLELVGPDVLSQQHVVTVE